MTSRTLRVVPVLGLLALSSCSIVPETGRSQFAVVPADMMNSLGTSAYAEETGKYREITGTRDAQMVARVGKRIAEASGRNYDWEFKLLDAPDTANAFCLPGGKIAIYTGILPITQNEAGLAAVMGHEVAHATANHGNERMTHGVFQTIGMSGLQILLDGWLEADEGTKGEIMGAIGMGTQYGVMLPFSRHHESEADEIGLRFLVRAGYDPNEAPKLWERMATAFPDRPAEFESTHPDPLARAARLRELIPKILAEENK